MRLLSQISISFSHLHICIVRPNLCLCRIWSILCSGLLRDLFGIHRACPEEGTANVRLRYGSGMDQV